MGLSDYFTFSVDVAFDAGPFNASPTWTEVTDDVLASEGVTFSRGTRSVGSRVGPGLADLTMRNWAEGSKVAGRWTPGVAASPWHPLKLKRRLRVQVIPSSVGVGVRTNLVANPSFETNTTGWDASDGVPTITRSTVTGHSGTCSLKVTPTSSAWMAVITSTRFAVTAGATYSISARQYVQSSRTGAITLVWYNDVDTFLSNDVGYSALSASTWNLVGRVSVAPAGATYARAYFAVVDSVAAEDWWLDSVIVEQVPAGTSSPGAYFDGSTSGYEWTGTAHASTSRTATYPLWSGHITDHTPGWVGAGKATCGLSCSDILAALARAKPFPVGAVLAEQLYDSPVLCYPLDEAAGATSAGDRSPARAPLLLPAQLGSGGGYDFGAGAVGPEESTCLALTRASAANGLYFSGASSAGTAATTDLGGGAADGIAVEAVVQPSAAASMIAAQSNAVTGYGWGSLWALQVGTDATGKPVAYLIGSNGATIATVTGPTALPTDTPSLLTATAEPVVDTCQIELYVNGVSAGTATATGLCPGTGMVFVGLGTGGNLWDGQIANVAVYDAVLSGARIAAHYQAMTGWAGESSGYRFARLAGLFGLPSGLISSGSGGVGILGPQAIAGKQITAALNEVADSDRGSINVDTEGALRFSGRTTRHGVATSVTLDARTDILNSLDGLAYNDEDLVNDATVTRDGGATVRHVNQASVDEYGSLTATADVILNSDDDAQSHAEWLANVHSQPAIKAPTLRVSMLNIASRSSSTAAALCALDLGQRITVTNLPAGLPATTLELFVEGINDEVGANDWVRTITTSNITRGGAVWVLGDATYSVLGSTTILA